MRERGWPLALLLTVGAQRAAASCPDASAPLPPSYPNAIVPAFPSNGLFLGPGQWVHDGVPLELEVDVALSSSLGEPVYLPTAPLVPGTVFVASEQGYCARPCSSCPSPCADWRLVISDLDDQKPTRPMVEPRTLLVRDPDRNGAFSCGDVDELELTIDTTDDTTTRDDITFGAYIAATAEAVDAATDFAVILGYDRTGNAPTTSTIVLGQSAGRIRSGDGFSVAGPFCFALAAFDRSGNISDRSSTTCLDTTDENDPTVVWVDSNGGCACNASSHGPTGWMIVFAVGACLRKRRSHRSSAKALTRT